MARHKPIPIAGMPNAEAIMQFWRECFAAEKFIKRGSQYSAVQRRVWEAFDKNHNVDNSVGSAGSVGTGAQNEHLYKALIEGGYLEEIAIDPLADGAEEYDLMMKGARIWASIQKNSGN